MTHSELQRIKDALDYRLNEHLCDMKEGWDDSVVGFNTAWDIMREFFKEKLEKMNDPL